MRIALSIILTLCVFVQFVYAQEVLTLPYEASGLTEEQTSDESGSPCLSDGTERNHPKRS